MPALQPKSVDFEALWKGYCQGPISALFSDDPSAAYKVEASLIYKYIKMSLITKYTNHLRSAIYHACVALPEDHMMKKILDELVPGDYRRNLQAYVQNWQTYRRGVDRTDALCGYLNRMVENARTQLLEEYPRKTIPFLMGNQRYEMSFRPMGALAMNFWRDGVLAYLHESSTPNVTSILDDIMMAIEELRQAALGGGNIISSNLIKDAIASIHWADPAEYPTPFRSSMIEDPDEQSLPPIPPTYYQDKLERPFLIRTRQFYAQQSARVLAERRDLTHYVVYAERVLRREAALVEELFPPDTLILGRVMAVVEEEVILRHAGILHADFGAILVGQDDCNLRIIYDLLKRIPEGVEPLATAYEAFVKEEAQRRLQKSCLQASNEVLAVNLVDTLAPLLEELQTQINKCLGGDERFTRCLHQALTFVLTQSPSSSPSSNNIGSGGLLAEYYDLLFRDQLPSSSSSSSLANGKDYDFDAALTAVTSLAPLLGNGIEEFTLAYMEALAARLLFRTSRHGGAEVATVECLKDVFGGDSRVRLSRMINDVAISHRLQRHFDSECQKAIPYEMLTLVPRYVTWPISGGDYTDHPAYRPPTELANVTDCYAQWYRQCFPNQRLTWLHTFSRIVLSMASPSLNSKPIELTCTIPQAKLLKLFDYRTMVLMREVCDELGVASQDDLQVMIDPIIKYGLLQMEGETLVLNANWQPPTRKMTFAPFSIPATRRHMPSILSVGPSDRDGASSRRKSSIISGGNNHEEILQLSDQRRYFLQAIIVRLLKERERLARIRLEQLVREIARLPGPLSFDPHESHLQLVLDQLEDKQYLEYDSKQDFYLYIP